MSYTRPPFDAADASWQGASAYTRPAFDAADASFEPVVTSVEAVGAAIIGPVTAAAIVAHGITAVGAAVIGPVTAAGVVEHTSHEVLAVGAAIIGPVTAAATVAHGIAGVGAAVIGPVTAVGQVAHGITAVGAAVIGPVVAACVAHHPRYSLKGEVRSGGVLVNRVVRAYRRDTGALVGEQATVSGRFDIHAGFEAREHYLLPVDLGEAAEDFTPPTANRVLSVLAMDA